MKKIDLGQMITILANLGVIAGIVFLGIETRQTGDSIDQSNRIAIADATTEMLYRNVEWLNVTLENPHIAELFVKLQTREQLTPAETVQAGTLALSLIQLWYSSEAYIENELIDEATFAIMLGAPAATIASSPGFGEYLAAVHRGNLNLAVEGSDSRIRASIEAALEANGL